MLVFAHGLTSTHRNVAAVADQIGGRVRVVAMDLRGRGNSSRAASGGYGMENHGRDVLAVMDALGIERAVLAGHSMGAYVATAAAVLAPHRAAGVVLVDGGVALPDDPVDDVDGLLEQMAAHAVKRLRATYPSLAAYRDEWRAMPYFEGEWGPIVELYLQYDLGFTQGAYRSKCDVDAVVEDWRDLLANPACATRLEHLTMPVLAVAAETGMTKADESVMSERHLAHLRSVVPDAECVVVPGTTHHTVSLGTDGAKQTAEAIVDFVARAARA